MNDNGSTTWAYDDETTESYDDWDDESVTSTGEIIPELLTGAPGAVLGGIGRLIRGPSRPPVPIVRVPTAARGVDTARLSTPRGEATLRLPDKVVTLDQFRQTTERLQEAINRNTTRLNSTQKDIEALSQRVGTVITNLQKEHKLALEKVRKQGGPQGMQNMLMSILMQQQLQEQIEDHTHPIPTPGTSSATGTATVSADDNTALMMLPLLMSGSSGSDDSTMLMMVAMMMTLRDRD